MGLPFFANKASGIAVFLGPTGGYLIGMFFAAVLIGHLSEKKLDRSLRTSIPVFMLGHVIIYFFGLLWLGNFTGYDKVFELGLIPFLPGLAVKTLLAGLITNSFSRF